jgi:hypothetical protein
MAENTTFYSGKYLIDTGTSPTFADNRQAWALPDESSSVGSNISGFTTSTEHFEETSNVEELLADPEDFTLIPEAVQAGCVQYDIGFYFDGNANYGIEDIANFYGVFYLGELGKGKNQQPTAISFEEGFYTVPVESGSIIGSRIVVEFC